MHSKGAHGIEEKASPGQISSNEQPTNAGATQPLLQTMLLFPSSLISFKATSIARVKMSLYDPSSAGCYG